MVGDDRAGRAQIARPGLCRCAGSQRKESFTAPPRAPAARALAARRQRRVARVCGGRPLGTAWASSYAGGDMRWVLAVVLAGLLALGAAASAGAATRTDATYFNEAAPAAADPYVLHDSRSGYYYAYSTDGADDGYHFGIYRSAH